MHIDDLIRYSEENYKNQLEEFFSRKFPGGQLVSHGLDHHRRVWNYAKELLHYINFKKDQQFVNSLMIACYLHDIGMVVDAGEKHGRHSRILCKEFLTERNLNPAVFDDLLLAVENHDDKEYSSPGVENNLQMILSAADDLDAFGETGKARYLEIYRMRGITEDAIPKSILDNAQKRFRNFEKIFSGHPHLVRKHMKRYQTLVDYFRSIDEEASNNFTR
ncbi:MAG: HD domain-containing protein [Bacteroidales bacterium]|jgi:HD superfamily phosphodiesterase|nr:HD domain-containing protein [Bacteroidales bacterium]